MLRIFKRANKWTLWALFEDSIVTGILLQMNLKNDITASNLFILRERLRVSFLYAFKFYFMIVFGSFITYDNSPRNRSRVLMLDGRVEASTTGMPALKGAVAGVNRPLPASNRSPRNSQLEDSVEESAGKRQKLF